MNDETFKSTLPAGAQVGGYVVHRVLGQGGFGVTYVCENPDDGKQWALKEFFPRDYCRRSDNGATVEVTTDSSDKDYQFALDRFKQEATVLAELNHENIVSVREGPIAANNTAYIVMEFVEGLSFGDWLKRQSKRPDEETLKGIFDQVFDAVDYLHNKDLMHRDLSPDNIMIKPGDKLVPVIIDFGTMGEGLDRDGRTTRQFLKPGYSPPEQALGAADQGRFTDIFALGATLYRAVTGDKPVNAAMRAHAKNENKPDPYVPAAQAVGKASSWSSAFLSGVDKALNMASVDRPQSISTWREDLGWERNENTQIEIRYRDKPMSKKAWIGFTAALAVAAGLAGWLGFYLGDDAPGMLDAQQKQEQLETKLRDTNAKLATAERQKVDVTKQRDRAIKQRDDLERDLKKAQAALSAATQGRGATSEQIARLTRERDLARNTTTQEKRRADAAKLRADTETRRVEELRAQLRTKNREVSRLEGRVAALERRNRKLDPPPPPIKTFAAVYFGFDFDGSNSSIDLTFLTGRSARHCASLCAQNSACKYFTFNSANAGKPKSCILKSGRGKIKKFGSAVSGVVFRSTTSGAPRLGGPLRRQKPTVITLSE